MLNIKLTRFVAMVMALVMTMAMAGCSEEPKQTDPVQTPENFVVTLENRGGTALAKCSVEIFSDASKTQSLYKGITNADGQVAFSALPGDSYVAVVSRVPDGYAVDEHYELKEQNTTIVLEPGTMSEADWDRVQYSLGDAVLDFTITGGDGTNYVLSELLQEKKAVVLNFCFLNCEPCKMEFPYLQEAYDLLSDDIAVLALNPYDGDATEVAAFQADNGYTFTMAKCDARWSKMMKVDAYPTTVVIDRYGNICLIHRGMVTETQTFLNMFGYFVSDSYEQTFVKSLSELPTYELNTN